jgi:Uma2 family endonuclease
MTPAEYLERERQLEWRNEYIDGRMVEMPHGNLRHSTIGTNLAVTISSQLRHRRGEVLQGIRVKVSQTGLYTYPDVVAVSEEPKLEDEFQDTLLNPSMIGEVLSPATEAYDRGEKFAQYRRITTLREYVLVSQNKIRVEIFRREGKQWILSELNTPDAILHLPSIDCHITLAEIYERVNTSI